MSICSRRTARLGSGRVEPEIRPGRRNPIPIIGQPIVTDGHANHAVAVILASASELRARDHAPSRVGADPGADISCGAGAAHSKAHTIGRDVRALIDLFRLTTSAMRDVINASSATAPAVPARGLTGTCPGRVWPGGEAYQQPHGHHDAGPNDDVGDDLTAECIPDLCGRRRPGPGSPSVSRDRGGRDRELRGSGQCRGQQDRVPGNGARSGGLPRHGPRDSTGQHRRWPEQRMYAAGVVAPDRQRGAAQRCRRDTGEGGQPYQPGVRARMTAATR
jgi:hypothetical protein